MKQIQIYAQPIKLQQFLKLAEVIGQGSDIKLFLEEGNITINGEIATQRGKKIYIGDKVEIKNIGFFEAVAKI